VIDGSGELFEGNAMYEQGLVKQVLPPCEAYVEHDDYIDCDQLDEEGHVHFVWDERSESDERVKAPCAYLPHSCDQWVIGGPEQIRLMIADLQEILKVMESVVQ
jgi:hypothetical protein